MNKIKVIACAAAMMLTQVLWAQSSPIPVLENAANQIIATLKQNKAQLKSNHQIIYQAVQQHLLPIVDVSGMSRSVLGREAWNKATAAERQEFTQEFTRLVIRTYANPLAEYSGETVKFLPIRGASNGKFIRVNSVIIRSSGQNIPLSYSLVSKSGQWKVYDLSVEGVSLLQSFRSQFGQVLQNSNMHDLIAQMRQKKGSLIVQERSFKPSNELTFDTVSSDCQRLFKLLRDDGITSIRLDLHDVTHCDSAGLALIIEAKKLCKQRNKKLGIDGASKAIYALAEFCGVEAILT